MKFPRAPEFRGPSFHFIAAAFAGLLSIVSGSLSASHADPATIELRHITTAKPPFILPAIGGKETELENARGQIVLVHFFATWCEPCREELPALNRLTERSKGAVKVLAISIGEGDTRVQRFLETTQVNFPVLLDRDRSVARAWQIATVPTTFVLDADLRPQLVVEMDFAWDGVDATKLAGLFPATPRKKTTTTTVTTTKPN